jgi:hypothetical protein
MSDLARKSDIPPLSPFPQFTLDAAKISCDFDLSVKPRPPVTDKPLRQLKFTLNDQLKQMRAALERDFAEFTARMKKLGVNEPLKMDALAFPDHAQLTQRTAKKHQPPPDPPKRQRAKARKGDTRETEARRGHRRPSQRARRRPDSRSNPAS